MTFVCEKFKENRPKNNRIDKDIDSEGFIQFFSKRNFNKIVLIFYSGFT